MKQILAFFAAAFTMAGCAPMTTKPVSPETMRWLKGESVAQTQRPRPDFGAMTAGKAMFGLIGAALMISEGNSLIAANQVTDPADEIANGLLKILESDYGTKPTEQRIAVSALESSEVAAAAGRAAGLVLDVRTVAWGYLYLPANWNRYRVVHTAQARLIHVPTGDVLAEGFCKRIPEDDEKAPTHDELLAKDAARLKRELAIAAQECVAALKAEMLTR